MLVQHPIPERVKILCCWTRKSFSECRQSYTCWLLYRVEPILLCYLTEGLSIEGGRKKLKLWTFVLLISLKLLCLPKIISPWFFRVDPRIFKLLCLEVYIWDFVFFGTPFTILCMILVFTYCASTTPSTG